MKPERWKEIEKVYQAAREREADDRQAYLDEACAGDEELRREVESLLGYEQKARDFIESPALDLAARELAGEEADSRIGSRIGSYRVLSLLGRGGMGEVYLAQDERLERRVALKFLPEELRRDETARRRFLREAKSAAALDHPFICKIYEAGEVDGTAFIAMEYVPGETLAEKLARGPLPLKKALETAVEVAEALEAAHRRSIVHRDLKPSNILITPQGHAKVMDFGLAKRLRSQEGADGKSVTVSADLSRTGMTLGTLAYMSPEQLRGEAVDGRSDIFSFGVVLYEMLAGVHPFRKPEAVETGHAILTETPAPLSGHLDPLPPPSEHTLKLESLIEKALEKDREVRYQSAGELLVDLKRLKRNIDSGKRSAASVASAGTPAAAAPRRRLPAFLGTGAASVLLVGYLFWPAGDVSDAFQLTNPVLLTTADGPKDYPTWRPDGSEIAYQSHQSGNWDIWVTQVKGPRSRNLTADHTGDDLYPSWSPDGSQIAFWSSREGGGEFVMPALGGRARKLVSTPADPYVRRPGPAQWSPDGTELAFVRFDVAEQRYYLEMVSVERGTSRRLPFPDRADHEPPGWELSWSPDGRYFAYTTNYDWASTVSQLAILRLADMAEIPFVSREEYLTLSPTWSPEGSLAFVSNRGGGMDLWRQRVDENVIPQGPPERLTTGIEMRYAAFSPDHRRLAYSTMASVANVWRVPILEDRPATWSEARQLTFERALIANLGLSPDGTTLSFTVVRYGQRRHIWLLSVEGGEMVRLLADPMTQVWPQWSPDGREIAFHSQERDRRNIWVAPVTGGPARNLTQSVVEGEGLDFLNPIWSPRGERIFFLSRDAENVDVWVTSRAGDRHLRLTEGGGQTGPWPARDLNPWSPDGGEIVFTSGRGGNPDLWMAAVEGGEPRQLTNHPAPDLYPSWSPDGRWILFSSDRTGHLRLWKVRPAGGDPEPVTGEDILPTGVGKEVRYQVKWSAEGNSIFLAAKRNGVENFYTLPVEGGTRRQLTDFRGKHGRLVQFQTDGRHLYFTWDETSGDIWVMDVAR